jgi:hypothetical protein
MAIDETRMQSRRALITSGVAALAAMGALALGRSSTRAATGDPVVLGYSNTADNQTIIRREDGRSEVALAGGTNGLLSVGNSDYSEAIRGVTTAHNGTGVYGLTQGDRTQVAIWADAVDRPGEGIALKGRTKNGVALWAECTGGEAIHAIGPTVFSRSGRLVFTAGQQTKTLKGRRLTAKSLVLATIQGQVAGLSVLGVTVNVLRQNFAIRLNKPAPREVVAGWFLVN